MAKGRRMARTTLSAAARDELEAMAEIAWAVGCPKTQEQIEADEQIGYASLLFTADEMRDTWIHAYMTGHAAARAIESTRKKVKRG
jgi:hypothetical protein